MPGPASPKTGRGAVIFGFKTSKLLALVVIIFYLVAILAVSLASIWLLVQIIIILGLCCSMLYVLRKFVWLLSAQAITAIWLQQGNRIIYYLAHGGRGVATIAPDSYISNGVIILYLLGRTKNKAIIITRDMLTITQYKQLLVRLKYVS